MAEDYGFENISYTNNNVTPAIGGADSFSGLQTVRPIDTEANVLLDEERNSKTFNEKVNAFQSVMQTVNFARDITKKDYILNRFKEDDVWKKASNDFSSIQMLSNAGLPITDDNIANITNSKSETHASNIISLLKEDMKTMEKADKVIGNFGKGSAVFISENVLDPSVALIPPMFKAATPLAAGVTAGLYETYKVVQDTMLDKNIGAIEDKVAMGAVNVMFDVAITRMFHTDNSIAKGMPVNKIDEPIEQSNDILALPAPLTKITDGKLTPEELIARGNQAEARIAEASRIAEEEARQSLITPIGESPNFVKDLDKARSRTMQQFDNDISELDKMINTANDFETNILPTRYEEQNMYSDMRDKASKYRQDLEAKREAVIDKKMQETRIDAEIAEIRKLNLEDAVAKIQANEVIPEYVKKTLVKHLEKVKEPEIKLAKRQEKLSSLGKRESEINDEISSLNKKISSYKRNTTFKANAIAKLEELKSELVKVKNSIKQSKNPIMNMDKANRTKAIKKAEDNLMITGLMAEDIAKVVNDLRPLVNKANANIWKDLKPDLDLLATKYPSIFNDLRRDVIGIIKNQDITNLRSNLINKLPKSKKIAVVSVIAGLGVSAQASDGTESDVGLEAIIGIALALVAGNQIVKYFRNLGIKNVIQRSLDAVKSTTDNATYQSSKDFTKFQRARRSAVALMRNSFLDTYAPIAKYGGLAKTMIDKLVHNPFGGSKVNASIRKDILIRSALSRIGYSMKVNRYEYVKEMGYSRVDSYWNSMKIEDEFNKAVSDVLEGGVSNSKAVNDMAKVQRKEYDLIKDKLIDLGYDSKMLENYFPRRWTSDSIRRMIFLNEELNRPVIENAITKAVIAGGVVTSEEGAKNIAKTMIDNMLEVSASGERQYTMYDDVFSKIEEFLDEGVTEADVLEKLTTRKQDMINSLKARNTMDINMLNDIQLYDVNGLPIEKVNSDAFVDRDSLRVFEEYANTAYGTISMAEQGYKTVANFMQDVAKVRKEFGNFAADELKRVGDHIFGLYNREPSNMYTTGLNILTSGAMFVGLSKSVFSTFVELSKAITNGNMFVLADAIPKAWKGMDNELMSKLMETTALGSSRLRDVMPERMFGSTVDDISKSVGFREEGLIGNTLDRAGKKLVREVVNKFGLGWASDYTQRINLVQSATKLANFIETGKGLPLNRLEYYGLDEETINTLKGIFTIDSRGKLLDLNTTSWTTKQEQTYQAVMRQITNEITPEASIGNYPSFLDNNAVGRIVAPLLRYSMVAQNVSGNVDLALFDRRALLNLVSGTLGAYIGIKLRSEVNNKKVDDETALLYAIMSQNIAGGVPSAFGIYTQTPMAMDFSNDIINNANSLSKIVTGEE